MSMNYTANAELFKSTFAITNEGKNLYCTKGVIR